jgi:hypothetical protein
MLDIGFWTLDGGYSMLDDRYFRGQGVFPLKP